MLEEAMLAEILTKNGAVHVVPVAIALQSVAAPAQEQVTVGVPLKVNPEGRAFVTAFSMPVESVGKKRAYSPPALTAVCIAICCCATLPKPAAANSTVINTKPIRMNSNAATPR